jgi:hypothetical protein
MPVSSSRLRPLDFADTHFQIAASTIFLLLILLTLAASTVLGSPPDRYQGQVMHYRRAGPLPVDLGTAINYVILAEAGISTVPASSITGNIAVTPIGSGSLTGFSETLDPSGTFSTSTQVMGQIFAANYNPPTPGTITIADTNMQAAYNDAASRTPPTATELGAGNIGGFTLIPGIYKWSTVVTIGSDLTLTGACGDVYIFQIAGDLNMASSVSVILTGGLLASQIFWQVAGAVTLGANSNFKGIILGKTGVTLQTGAIMQGRIYAQTAVALQMATVMQPPPFTPTTCTLSTTSSSMTSTTSSSASSTTSAGTITTSTTSASSSTNTDSVTTSSSTTSTGTSSPSSTTSTGTRMNFITTSTTSFTESTATTSTTIRRTSTLSHTTPHKTSNATPHNTSRKTSHKETTTIFSTRTCNTPVVTVTVTVTSDAGSICHTTSILKHKSKKPRPSHSSKEVPTHPPTTSSSSFNACFASVTSSVDRACRASASSSALQVCTVPTGLIIAQPAADPPTTSISASFSVKAGAMAGLSVLVAIVVWLQLR